MQISSFFFYRTDLVILFLSYGRVLVAVEIIVNEIIRRNAKAPAYSREIVHIRRRFTCFPSGYRLS